MNEKNLDDIEAAAKLMDSIDVPTDNRYFFCIYCNRAIEIKDGAVVHDDVEHPEFYDFAEAGIDLEDESFEHFDPDV